MGEKLLLFEKVLKDMDLSNIEPIRELDEECLHELDEFKLILESFKPEIQPLIGFEELLNKFKAGLNHKTSFAVNEILENGSLSGGERSVVAICLAACCRRTALTCIDEINQGMDEKFETAAHELILGLKGQVLVTSPKLGKGMEFNGNIVVHVFIKDGE